MQNPVKKLALALLGLAMAWTLSAQTTITGVVTDESGEPLIGAGVVVEGTTVGTVTGLDGDYTLTVPADAVNLVFSFIGLSDQTVPIAGQTVINVTLTEDSTFLDEVVVVGYQTVKRRDLLGAVASVGSDKLSEQPVTSVSQALSGKMAGVSVITTEGDPDADVKIRVRGGSSITQDNSPLYIVDGFPVESINDIPSSEIQSIDVLKDAFSTAIYGSRGANGVVIVTTKSAEKGQKVSVKFNAYYGLKKMANADAIVAMDPENFVKFQYELASIRDNVSSNYNPYFGTFNDIDLYKGLAGNDWVDAVFGKIGSTMSADFSISGSGDNFNWTMGYAHMGEDAIMIGSDYARDNLSFKANFKTSEKTSIDANIRYSRINVRGGAVNSIGESGTSRSTNSGNGRLKHAVSYAPIPVAATTTDSDLEQDYGDNAPPLRSVADNDTKRLRSTWNANAAFNWNIIEGLRLKIEGGLEDYRQTDERFYGLTTYAVNNDPDYPKQPINVHKDLFRTRYRNTNTLNYDFAGLLNNSKHGITALLGEEMTITKSNTLTNQVGGFPTFYDADMTWNFMASGVPTSTNNYYSPDDKLLSFFGRVNYDYDHRYSLGVTLRADGSSKFARGHRWGFFPSAAASWTISNESWMDNAHSWLDQLKLRYSFGTAGNNNIPSGQLMKEYAATTTSWLSMTNNIFTAGKILDNPNLTWETTYTHNIGLDFSLFQSRLSGSLEAYQNDTKNLLINFPIPGSGYDSQYQNVGSTRNRGLELTLNAPVVSNKDFSLNIGGNIAYNVNRVTDLGGLESITAQSYWASTEIGDDYIVQVGQPLGNMYGYVSDGMYTVDDFTWDGNKWVLNEGVADASSLIGSGYMRPGAPKYKNMDGSKDNKVTAADRRIIGNAAPDFTGGFNLSGFFKGLDFSANFNFMIGNQVYNANKVEFTSSRKYYNRNLINMMDVDKRWTNVDWTTGELITDAATLRSVNAGKTMWNPAIGSAVFSDWAVEDASFLRLQTVTVGYSLPEKLIEKASLSKVRFYVTGTNLFCLTKYSGYDPEVDTRRSTPLTPGVDYSAYPKSIGFVAGVNIVFGRRTSSAPKTVAAVAAPAVREVVKEIVKEVVKEKVVEKEVVKEVKVPASTLEGIYEDDLYFLIGKSELRPDEAFKLGRICQILKDNPDAKISVTGYADSGTGTSDINMTLSEQRAAVVADMLKKAGIAASRITSDAAGKDKDASASPESNRVAVCIVK